MYSYSFFDRPSIELVRISALPFSLTRHVSTPFLAIGSAYDRLRRNRSITTPAALSGPCQLRSRLRDRGHSVHVVDLLLSPGLDRRAEFVQGSILDALLMRRAMAHVDQVFHLAANAHLWAPDKHIFLETNFHGTQVVLEVVVKAWVQRVVHTSTELVLVTRRTN